MNYWYTLFSFYHVIGGEHEFTANVGRDFYNIHKNQDGRNVIREGWSAKLSLLIWNNLHLPCGLSFRRAKYRKEDILASGGNCRHNFTSPHQQYDSQYKGICTEHLS